MVFRINRCDVALNVFDDVLLAFRCPDEWYSPFFVRLSPNTQRVFVVELREHAGDKDPFVTNGVLVSVSVAK